jgi:hypothetical protein
MWAAQAVIAMPAVATSESRAPLSTPVPLDPLRRLPDEIAHHVSGRDLQRAANIGAPLLEMAAHLEREPRGGQPMAQDNEGSGACVTYATGPPADGF